MNSINKLRSTKEVRTAEERAARNQTPHHPDSHANRVLFGVGQNLASETTARLYHPVLDSFVNLTARDTTPVKYKLKGVPLH